MTLDLTKRPVLLITGMSGSGRSFALKTLEDMGYETIDNLPLSVLDSVARAKTRHKSELPLAMSIDVRTRDFSSDQFLKEFESLSKDPEMNTQLVFFDCEDEVLNRRYNESRRLHPLAHERPVMDGIRLERHLMMPLRESADLVIDTSDLQTKDLRGQMRRYFMPSEAPALSIFITSFSFRNGVPREADMVFDARPLKNPFYDEALRSMSGEDPEVADYIKKDPILTPFWESIQGLLSTSLPRFEEEGRGYLNVAVGCTGGQHRSVFIAKSLVEWLQEAKKDVRLRHRDIKVRKTI